MAEEIKPFKRPKNWRSKPLTPEAVEGFKSKITCQTNRADIRAKTWKNWRCTRDRWGRLDQAPRDDNGVISRRTRRSIARSIAKKAWSIMNRRHDRHTIPRAQATKK